MNNKPYPRLLYVTPRYFPYMGGIENHVYQVATRLASRGVDVTVLSTDPSGKLAPFEQNQGVKIQRVKVKPNYKDFYFAPDIYRIINAGNWDVIHVQSYHTFVAPLAMLAAQRAHVPYVLTFHGGGHSSRGRNAVRGLQHRLLKPLFMGAKRLVATAKFELDYFGRRLGIPEDRFTYIPNGSDLLEPGQRKAVECDDNLIVSIGRLERYKGHQRILAALPYILKERPQLQLWIAGSGSYEPELHRMAKELDVQDHVIIRGIPVEQRSRMAHELSKVALAVLLSEYETNPMAILEALALGRPALVANTSGLAELADEGLARSIPITSTPSQVAEAVMEQLRSPLLPPEGFNLPTWDDCASALLSLYTSVV